MKDILVSIVVPLFNREELLKETIESVLNQTYENWELIIVDDGSTDNSFNVANSFATDLRIKVLKRNREPKGACTCRNIGFENSNGEFVIFLDSDDLLSPECLNLRVHELKQNECDFIVSPSLIFDKEPYDNNVLVNILETNENDLDRFLKQDVAWASNGVTWKKEFLEKIGKWDETLPSWQDWELFIRALSFKPTYFRTKTPDSFWRKPNASSIGKESTSPSHLDSHTTLLTKITKLLCQKNLLTLSRKKYLAGIYIWIGNEWMMKYKNISKAIEQFKTSYENNLINIFQYYFGIIYSIMWKNRITAKMARNLFKLLWSKDYQIEYSKTFRSIKYIE